MADHQYILLLTAGKQLPLLPGGNDPLGKYTETFPLRIAEILPIVAKTLPCRWFFPRYVLVVALLPAAKVDFLPIRLNEEGSVKPGSFTDYFRRMACPLQRTSKEQQSPVRSCRP